MKLAYFSPLNPQPSGISDYSEELLPYLARKAQVDLFVDGFIPSSQYVKNKFLLLDYRKDPSVLKSLDNYDAVIYHVGNDHRYHSGIAAVMRQHSGIAVFHDFALQDFFLGQANAERNMRIYLDELGASHGPEQRRRAEDHLRRGSMPPQVNSPLTFPLNASLARAAEGIIVHSEWSRQRFAAVAPGVPVRRINHHITARAAAAAVSVKESGECVRIASFGLITPDKGIERALAALSKLRDDHDFQYVLVGSATNFPGLNELVKSYGLENHVVVTGLVSLEEFERQIAQTDIAINLRERPVGATSGSLCRLMAAAVPTIISNVEAFSELPDAAVVKIDHDEYAAPLLEAYLRKLIEDQNLRQQIGRNARNHVLAHHRIETSAEGYLEFIQEVIARRPRKHFIQTVAGELTKLGVGANDDSLLRSVASEIALVAPVSSVSGLESRPASTSGNGHRAKALAPNTTSQTTSTGRVRKLEGIDYKRAAVEYLSKLSGERQHHLRTKPFYNLANKPARYQGEGMDEDMHRHFCDFANIAVTLALPAGARILDVGCGSGWLSEYFARLGYQVKGIDISPDLIEMSRERVSRVPYGVDDQTPLHCDFAVHDVELAPLDEKFAVIICYDSLHHFEDEHAVLRHLAMMLDVGGLLFILEGHKPGAASETETELLDVMREFGTLESPFSDDYLRQLISDNGFAIVGDYVSVNGLFEREMLEGKHRDAMLPLRTVATDYHYLTCMKVAEGASAVSVSDSRQPGVLRAEFTPQNTLPQEAEAGERLELAVTVKNAGDTLWLSGQTVRKGVVMPGVRIFDTHGQVVAEFHGHPMLPRAVPPGQTVALNLQLVAPTKSGTYSVKIDLVDQHVCWFEEKGSEPLTFSFKVKTTNRAN